MKKVFLVVFLAALIAEVYLSYNEDLLVANSYINSILSKVWSAEKTNIAMPPFPVILNKDWDKPERLEEVYKYSRWPPNTQYIGQDFLRFKSDNYKININSLGFRGREVEKNKPKNTFRILAYGAYMTFGQAVADDETYVSRAEEIVNKRLTNKKVEILNGGMECGTFIMGLSRLHHELESTDADGVLFEYGFVDGNQVPHDKIPDNYNTLIGSPELEPALTRGFFGNLLHNFLRFYDKLEIYLYKSKLYAGFRVNVLQHTGDAIPVGFEDLRIALTKTSKDLAAKGKKVFILINPGLPTQGINALTAAALESGAILVNGRDIFANKKPTQGMLDDFDKDPNNFLKEVGFKRPDVNWRKGLDFKVYAPYYQNLFQLSPLGHQVIGEGLADKIEDYLKVPSKNDKLK